MLALQPTFALVTLAAFVALCAAKPLPEVIETKKGNKIRCIPTTIEGLDIYGTPAMLSGKVTEFDLAKGRTAHGYFGESYVQPSAVDKDVKFHLDANWDVGKLTLRNEANSGDTHYVYMIDIETSNRGGADAKTKTFIYYLFHNDQCETELDGSPRKIVVSAIIPRDGSKSSS